MKEIISPVDTEDGLFHDGDPSTGTEGTVVSQKWLNPVQGAVISSQQEMAAVLKEAGIKIDPSKQDQLLAAIKKITGTAVDGYVKRGEFGIGGDTPIISSSGTLDIIKTSKTGRYAVNQGSTDMPSTAVSYELDWTSTSAGRYGVLIAKALIEKGSIYNKTFRNSLRKGIWQGWVMFYDEENKPSPTDLNVYSKTDSDGRYAFKSITVNGKPLSSNVNLTAGDVNAWNKTEADGRFIYKSGDTIAALTITKGLYVGEDTTVNRNLFVGGSGFVEKRGVGDVINNVRYTNGYRIFGAGNLFADIYHNERVGQNHFLGIHVANGGADGWFEFRNDGQFIAGSIVGAGGGNGSKLHPDGNLQGSIWGGYLADWLNKNVSNAQNNAQNWAYQNLVQNVRLTGRINQPDTGGRVMVPDGCVFTGMSGANYDPSIWGAYSYVQVLINGSWRNIGTS
ncbi:hypothetical protein ACYZFV_10045 [Serratia ureilytica]